MKSFSRPSFLQNAVSSLKIPQHSVLLVKNSFYCGLTFFLLGLFFSFVKELGALAFFTNIIPGFAYTTVLTVSNDNASDLRKAAFIILGGLLFILVAWVATATPFIENLHLSMLVASTSGALALFCLYFVFLDRNINFRRGAALAFFIGLLSSIGPMIAYSLEVSYKDTKAKEIVKDSLLFSIFIVWQSSFGWMVVLLKKTTAKTNLMRYEQHSISSAKE